MTKSNKGKTISIRLSESMLEALDAHAILYEKDRTQVIREAISKHLDLPDETLDSQLEALSKKQSTLNKLIDKLENQLKNESKKTDSIKAHFEKKTDSIEVRLEELGKIITVFLEKT